MSRYVRVRFGNCGRIIDLNRVVDGCKVSHYNEGEIGASYPAGWYWPENEEYGIELECRDEDIIMQADTIEELCDQFVCIGDKYLDIYKRVSDRNYDLKAFDVYGAIWTGKGLIFVAKMNEKGELELL